MKKTLLSLSVLVSLGFVTYLLTANARAAGQLAYWSHSIEVVDNASTGVADGKTPYTFTIRYFGWKCGVADSNGNYMVFDLPSGCNTLGRDFGSPDLAQRVTLTSAHNCCMQANVDARGVNKLSGGDYSQVYVPGTPYVTTRTVAHADAQGLARISLTTEQAGSRVITVDNGHGTAKYEWAVNFIAPATPAPSAPRATVNTPSSTPAAATLLKIALKPSDVYLSGKQMEGAESTKKPVFNMGEVIKLSGKTVPNGLVTLYIFSEPKRAEVTADASGNWSYEMTDLPAGDHHVEMEVKNPADGSMSDRVVLGSFTLKQPPAVASTLQEPSIKKAIRQNLLSTYALVAGCILLLLGVVYRKQVLNTVARLSSRGK